MKDPLKLNSIRLILAVAMGLTASAISSRAQSSEATATITGVAVSGGFDYTISLENTGTGDLNTFWYGWTDDGNNLPSNPDTAENSLGWANNLDGNSIVWENDASTALAPGQTGAFTFFSSDSPSDITTSPSGGSVVYNGVGIFSAGQSDAFSPALAATPELGSSALLAAGAFSLFLLGRKKSGVLQKIARH
jgi:hypothetical protein